MRITHKGHITINFALVAALLLFSPLFLSAQAPNQNVQNTLSSMFEFLDMQLVPTGYLKDKSFELVDLSLYNGINQPSNLNPDRSVLFASILTINSAKVQSSLPDYNAPNFISAFNDTTGVVIGATLFKYNFIVSNAISDSLIVYQNGKLYYSYHNGYWNNPYDEAYSFVFAPGVSAHRGKSIRYKFSSSQFLTNCQIQTIEFDPGTGIFSQLGYSYNQEILYTTTGTKLLRLRVTLTNGIVLLGHSSIEILEEAPPLYAPSSTSGTISHNRIELTSNPSVYAIVTTRFPNSHNGQFVRPLIYVEGFDHPIMGIISSLSENNINDIIADLIAYALMEKANLIRGAYDFYWFNDKVSQMADIYDNYDIVYIDWGNPMASILDNALLLEQIIATINESKAYQSDSSKNTIIGHSMGGIITRVALSNMERNSIPHETMCYVSFDSPHKGANFPIGIQYAILDFGRLLYSILGSSLITNNNTVLLVALYNEILECMRSPSAVQMLYYQILDDYSLDSSSHTNWQHYLDSFIGFPKGDSGCPMEILSIVNGGSLGITSNPLASIYASIGNNSTTSFGLWLLTWLSNINFSFDINYNQGNGGLVAASEASYIKKRLFLPNQRINLLSGNTTHYSPIGTTGFDETRSSVITSKDILPMFNDGDTLIVSYNDIAFIPVASALAIDDYETVIINHLDSLPSTIPFSSIYIADSTSYHGRIDNNYLDWIYRQSNLKIIGPMGFAKTGDTFSVQRIGSNYSNEEWYTSDPLVASIIGDSLVVHKPGPVRISYCCEDSTRPNTKFYKHRSLFAGIPEMVLSKERINNTCTVRAQCKSSYIRAAFNESVADSVFAFRWGKKVGLNDIQWEESTTQSSYYNCQIVEDEYISVFMKLITKTGIEGPVYTILVQKGNYDIFCHDPQGVYVDSRFVNQDYQFVRSFKDSNGLFFRPWLSFCLWRSYGIPDSLVPDSVRIGSQSFPLFNTTTVYDDLTPITLYEFLIMGSTLIQQAVEDIQSTYNNPIPYIGDLIPIEIVCDDIVVQTVILPVIRHDLSLP